MSDPEPGSDQLRSFLDQAGEAARVAADALLQFPLPNDQTTRDYAVTVRDYCLRCADPLQALEVARLLRNLVYGFDLEALRHGPLREWANAEVRLQALVSRVSRTLREEGEKHVEAALVGLANLRLNALEDGARYLEVLSEMSRLVDGGSAVRPLGLLQEFLAFTRER